MFFGLQQYKKNKGGFWKWKFKDKTVNNTQELHKIQVQCRQLQKRDEVPPVKILLKERLYWVGMGLPINLFPCIIFEVNKLSYW